VNIKSTNLGDVMSKSLAVAISVGILAAVWNALSGDYLGNIVATSIPVGFIAWACSGLAGKSDAMQKNSYWYDFWCNHCFRGNYDWRS